MQLLWIYACDLFHQQVKYKQSAEMEKANYTTVVDTPDIIHAHNVKNLASQVIIIICLKLTCQN